jgi:ankyrin repeat protein
MIQDEQIVTDFKCKDWPPENFHFGLPAVGNPDVLSVVEMSAAPPTPARPSRRKAFPKSDPPLQIFPDLEDETKRNCVNHELFKNAVRTWDLDTINQHNEHVNQMVDFRGGSVTTALHHAIKTHRLDAVKLLHQLGADCDFPVKFPTERYDSDRMGMILKTVEHSPFAIACANRGCLGIVKFFVDDVYVDIEEKDSDGQSVLMTACGLEDPEASLEMVQFLLKRKANLRAVDANGWTALTHACTTAGDKVTVVQYLIDEGAAISYAEIGLTFLVHETGNTAMLQLLLDADASDSVYNDILLRLRPPTADTGDLLLQSRTNGSIATVQGLLLLACHHGRIDIVQNIIDLHGKEVFHDDCRELLAACDKEHGEILSCLEEHDLGIAHACNNAAGRSPRCQSDREKHCLLSALLRGHADDANELLQNENVRRVANELLQICPRNETFQQLVLMHIFNHPACISHSSSDDDEENDRSLQNRVTAYTASDNEYRESTDDDDCERAADVDDNANMFSDEGSDSELVDNNGTMFADEGSDSERVDDIGTMFADESSDSDHDGDVHDDGDGGDVDEGYIEGEDDVEDEVEDEEEEADGDENKDDGKRPHHQHCSRYHPGMKFVTLVESVEQLAIKEWEQKLTPEAKSFIQEAVFIQFPDDFLLVKGMAELRLPRTPILDACAAADIEFVRKLVDTIHHLPGCILPKTLLDPSSFLVACSSGSKELVMYLNEEVDGLPDFSKMCQSERCKESSLRFTKNALCAAVNSGSAEVVEYLLGEIPDAVVTTVSKHFLVKAGATNTPGQSSRDICRTLLLQRAKGLKQRRLLEKKRQMGRTNKISRQLEEKAAKEDFMLKTAEANKFAAALIEEEKMEADEEKARLAKSVSKKMRQKWKKLVSLTLLQEQEREKSDHALLQETTTASEETAEWETGCANLVDVDEQGPVARNLSSALNDAATNTSDDNEIAQGAPKKFDDNNHANDDDDDDDDVKATINLSDNTIMLDNSSCARKDSRILCTMPNQVMRDPVLANDDGNVYGRDHIQDRLGKEHVSPLKQHTKMGTVLKPLPKLKAEIEETPLSKESKTKSAASIITNDVYEHADDKVLTSLIQGNVLDESVLQVAVTAAKTNGLTSRDCSELKQV